MTSLLTLLAFLALCAGQAHAAQRYASASSNSGGGCAQGSPCSLETAIEGAVDGDEVIVLPGTYAVRNDLNASARIDLHGVAGEPHPVLVGDIGLQLPTLTISTGSLVRHLTIDSNGDGADGVTIKAGALVEDIWVTSASGDGAKVVGDPAKTILRDSAIHTSASDSSHAAIKLRDGPSGGDVILRNVTAWGTNGNATGIKCETNIGHSSLVNTLVRGAAADLDASAVGVRCAASYSNFRTSLLSSGLAAGTGVSGEQPLLQAPEAGDFRPKLGSPTIDAGTTDQYLGLSDPDGRPRHRGYAPDIGAFEHPEHAQRNGEDKGSTGSKPGSFGGTEGGTQAGTPSPALPGLAELPAGVAPPVMGKTVVLAPASGVVLVRHPNGKGYTPLRSADDLPVGTIIDASRGVVRLSTALDAGHQTGTFRGGAFEVRQAAGARGMTDLVLRGGSFRACRRTTARKAVAVAARKRRPRTVRRLWGSDRGGRFRTRGRNSVATVRGTTWLTEDRCDGTLTRVTEGAVDVRNLRRGTSVLVRAGRSRLVRGPR